MPGNSSREKDFIIRRGRVDSVSLYEVKENELDVLEHGEQTSVHLNFAIFLLSTAISNIVALATGTFTSSLVQNLFLFTSIVGVLLGFYLVILWWRGRQSINSVIKTIRDRIEPAVVEVRENEVVAVEPTYAADAAETKPDE